MIRVHIWHPDSTNVGHAAAELSGTASTEYVSWWPNEPTIAKKVIGQQLTFAEDVASEGRSPDTTHQFDDLDPDAASQWWLDFLANDPHYHLGSTNCSWAVVSALKAAGADARFPWHRLLEKHNLKHLHLPNAGTLKRYLISVFNLKRDGNSWDFATMRPLIDMLDDLLPVWSPRDTDHYCHLLDLGIRGADLKFPLIGV